MIEILLATYNGEAYLREQLDSILLQDYFDWQLLIRDDCSTDRTDEIILEYAGKFPDKIRILENNGMNLGACQNFVELLRHAQAQHVMLCDQDDVWLPDKIRLTMTKMAEMEAVWGTEVPLLVHTNFKIVDAELAILAESGWKYLNINPVKDCRFNRLLVNNAITGCTMMINKPLRNLALPIPAEAIMHDWWLALVAATFGQIGTVAQSSLLYRQHGGNVSGGKVPWGTGHILRQLADLDFHRREIQRIRRQAGAFLAIYRDRLKRAQKKMLEIYSTMGSRDFLTKRFFIVRYGLFYPGIIRNLGLFLIC